MPEEWTVRRVLAWTTKYFRAAGVEAARFEAETLLAHALRTERLELYLHPERVLSEEERGRFRGLVRRRRAGTPLAYLLGTVEFMDATLKVDRSVLIPRVETEELVEHVLREVEVDAEASPPLRLLDLGTGSGAVAIALLRAWPQARAVAVDLSLDALRLARENARLNGVARRLELVCSDWQAALRGAFDLIVSNPPYIPTEEIPTLPREVRAHEPHKALDGGTRGLEAIERIIRGAPSVLRPGGRLYLEIGSRQAEDVRGLLECTHQFESIEVLRDLAGHERIVRARRRGDL